jgi:GNAT superfamily N-acetyltransferase
MTMTHPPVAQIRRALPSEARLLSDLALEAKQYWGYSGCQMEEWCETLRLSEEDIGTANPIFVAAIGDEVAGFYSLVPGTAAWELDHLWVRPRFMRAGIGRALFEHSLATAYAGGASLVTIDADPNAEPFYLACGAERTGAMPAPIAGQPERMRPQLVVRTRAT